MSPIYDFRCTDKHCAYHQEPFEARLPIADRDTTLVRCPICAGPAARQVVPSKAPTCVITKPLNHGGNTKERILP